MAKWWQEDWLQAFADEPPPELLTSRRDRLTRRLYADTMQGELQELLRYGDRNSMAWSRELRQPFLDHRLAELLFALPPEYKLVNGETKVIMREAMKGLVPDGILQRQDKLGYQAPLPTWLGGALSTWAEERLEQASAELSERLVCNATKQFLRIKRPLSESDARAIFSLSTLGESLRQLRLLVSPSVVVS
jgi:asparagine synthetase B (glutamine-hydrolysing)